MEDLVETPEEAPVQWVAREEPEAPKLRLWPETLPDLSEPACASYTTVLIATLSENIPLNELWNMAMSASGAIASTHLGQTLWDDSGGQDQCEDSGIGFYTTSTVVVRTDCSQFLASRSHLSDKVGTKQYWARGVSTWLMYSCRF